ncbi:helix-turn-helix domain-containing protein [Streptomyces sp. NPDC006450]|uniref:helix-turn-helix domain-containing protein n=1 Tax=Streptomyces sp. NPDC006450 TaxID=3155458 RepID=UPI0033B6D0C8
MSESSGGAGVEGAGEPGSAAAARALGVQLRLLRENAGLSQRAMVALHGGSITSVSRYENGDRLPRSSYVEALLEEADRRGRTPLTTGVRELVTALYERALGPVGGRNSERAALYEQERALREVQDREAETARLLAELADQGQGLRADAEAREALEARAAQLERLSGHLAVQRRQIVGRIDGLLAGLPAEHTAELVPHTGTSPPSEGVSGAGRGGVPPWGHRSPPAHLAGLAAVLIAVAAIVWGAVLLQRGDPASTPGPVAGAGPQPGAASSDPSSTPSPTPTPSSSPSPSPSPTISESSSATPSPSTASSPPSPIPPPETRPPAPKVPAAVRVRWRGTLTLDDGSKSGSPTTGWFLDPVPPQRAPLGDLGLACQLSCDPGRYVGNTIVAFDGSGAPERQECVDLLNTQLGQRTADVPAGRTACFGTEAGRVGYFTPGTGNGGRVRLDVTVWELPA